jgi:Flp pilus assembly protein CpaB
LKAATVRVNDIDGVGGFVLPGDHVDVTLTRQVDKTNASAIQKADQPSASLTPIACALR